MLYRFWNKSQYALCELTEFLCVWTLLGQYLEATENLLETAKYLRSSHPDVLGSYAGDSVGYMLDAVRTRSTRGDDPVPRVNNSANACTRESVLSIVDSLQLRLEKQKLSIGGGGGDNISPPAENENGTYWQSRACDTVDCFEILRFRLREKQLDSNFRADDEEEAEEENQLIGPREPRRNSTAEEKEQRVDHERSRRRSDNVLFDAKSIQKASHIMHYIGIAIVGLFAVQVSCHRRCSKRNTSRD